MFANSREGLTEATPSDHAVYTNDVNPAAMVDTHCDALQPTYINDFLSQHGIKGLVVTSPPYSIVDLCIPMLVKKLCHQPQFYHLGYSYLLNVPLPIHQFLERLGKEGRLHIVTGLPRNKTDVLGVVGSYEVRA